MSQVNWTIQTELARYALFVVHLGLCIERPIASHATWKTGDDNVLHGYSKATIFTSEASKRL